MKRPIEDFLGALNVFNFQFQVKRNGVLMSMAPKPSILPKQKKMCVRMYQQTHKHLISPQKSFFCLIHLLIVLRWRKSLTYLLLRNAKPRATHKVLTKVKAYRYRQSATLARATGSSQLAGQLESVASWQTQSIAEWLVQR